MKSRFAKVLVGLAVSGAAAGVGFGASTAISSAATTSPRKQPNVKAGCD
jgi:F0F1-type ATP synthase membrane subunit c/vacuolar-type H+-ATPase subunit K